MFYKIGSWNCY